MLSTLGSWRKHLLKYKLKQIKALEYLEYFSTIIRQELKKKMNHWEEQQHAWNSKLTMLSERSQRKKKTTSLFPFM